MAKVQNFSEKDVLAMWNNVAGKIDAFVLQEGTYVKDSVVKPFLALIDKVSGSVCVQVNDVEKQEALNVLAKNVGSTLIDPSVHPSRDDSAKAGDAGVDLVPGEIEVLPPVGVGYGVENPAISTTAVSGLDDLNKRPKLPEVKSDVDADVKPEAGTQQAQVPENKVVAPFDPAAKSAEDAVPTAGETQETKVSN